VVACPKFENAQIIASTAMLLLILHLAPFLFYRRALGATFARNKRVCTSRATFCSFEISIAREKTRTRLHRTDPDILALEEFAASTEATSNTPLSAVDVAGMQLGGARQSPSRLNSSSGC
jgi:hypothetical protein